MYIYKNMPDINGIVHTHSPYATAFAAAERPIPVLFTETAEEFGGEIPLSEFVLIGDEAIGEQVVKFGAKTKAVVLRKHGIFTIGASPEKAVDLAILAENSAFIAWLSIHLESPDTAFRKGYSSALLPAAKCLWSEITIDNFRKLPEQYQRSHIPYPLDRKKKVLHALILFSRSNQPDNCFHIGY